MSAVTYTPAAKLDGPTFTCSRCLRVYAYPHDHGAPIRCECGWWYYNVGEGQIMEKYHTRIGGEPGKA
jgi:hypothetical protein